MYKFKECREAAGISQKSAAITIGVKPPSMSDWESGRTAPPCDKLVRLASLYGVTVDELLGLSGKRSQMSPEERQLLRIFAQLNPAGRSAVLAAADALLRQDGMRKENGTASAV